MYDFINLFRRIFEMIYYFEGSKQNYKVSFQYYSHFRIHLLTINV